MARIGTIRGRFEELLAGEAPARPVYAVYDWFVKNRPTVDWGALFGMGLGQIAHANLVRHVHPNFKIVEETSGEEGQPRRDVWWITDRGELHEWYLGEWRQEHFIKSPEDYRTMAYALEGVQVLADERPFLASEKAVGENGITLGQVAGLGMGRTPLMTLQIDWVGLERFSLDLASGLPEMLELLEIMDAIKLEEARQAAQTPAQQIKLWENLSVETIGPAHYRRYLVPLYRQIIGIFNEAGKRLQVHYDGQLSVIAADIAALDFDGIDSFTEPPEGDMTVKEAHEAWPDKFLWLHPNLGWYGLPDAEFAGKLEGIADAAGPTRYCVMISEEVPPDWQRKIPLALSVLKGRHS